MINRKTHQATFSLLLLFPLYGPVAEEMRGGFISEDPATYLSFPVRPPYRSLLPAGKDLSQYFPPPGRQGAQSSCVGWAIGYATRSYYARTSPKSAERDSVPFSPSFIYNQTIDGNCEAGSSISSGLDILKRVGILSLSEFPYDPKDCLRKPTGNQLEQARGFRIRDWARVALDSPDAIKAEIHQGNPVIFGMKTSPSFYRMKAGVYSSTEEPKNGSHAMVVVGYQDSLGAFKVINSWGPNWGENGFGWISYETVMKNIQNAFVIIPNQDHTVSQNIDSESKKPEIEAFNIELLENVDQCTSLIQYNKSSSKTDYIAVVGSQTAKRKIIESLPKEFSDRLVDIKVLPWPQCEAFKILKPILSTHGQPEVSINGSPEVRLKEGDEVLIRVAGLTYSYVAVFYLQADGSAVQLRVPNRTDGSVSPAEILLGGSTNKLHIEKPLGEEMIVVIESDRPFPEALDRKTIQGDTEFLKNLKEWLSTHSESDLNLRTRINASVAILHTQ